MRMVGKRRPSSSMRSASSGSRAVSTKSVQRRAASASASSALAWSSTIRNFWSARSSDSSPVSAAPAAVRRSPPRRCEGGVVSRPRTRPVPDPGPHLDPVLEAVGPRLRDRESQAEALSAKSTRGVVDLGDRLEDRLPKLRRDPDPGIPDLDAQLRARAPAAEEDTATAALLRRASCSAPRSPGNSAPPAPASRADRCARPRGPARP